MADIASKPDEPTATLENVGTDGTTAIRLAQLYAEALLNVAEKRGQTDDVAAELSGVVGELFARMPDLPKLLLSRIIPRDKKAKLIDAAFGDNLGELTLDFIRVLNGRDRLELLRPVAGAYRTLLDRRRSRVRVVVRSAVPLSREIVDSLKATLSASLGKEPVLESRIDESLLGGMILQVGDEVYDSSVKTRLESIRTQLLSRSSYEIQVRRDHFSS